ncbi:YrhK family protein [Roseivivax sp. CAU 1761]
MLFHEDNGGNGKRAKKLKAVVEVMYTSADFLASIAFLVGSIFFLYEHLHTAGTWLFIIGSVLFASKPTMSFFREVKLAAMGDDEDLAERKSAP